MSGGEKLREKKRLSEAPDEVPTASAGAMMGKLWAIP
jgi:hypothetical protein